MVSFSHRDTIHRIISLYRPSTHFHFSDVINCCFRNELLDNSPRIASITSTDAACLRMRLQYITLWMIKSTSELRGCLIKQHRAHLRGSQYIIITHHLYGDRISRYSRVGELMRILCFRVCMRIVGVSYHYVTIHSKHVCRDKRQLTVLSLSRVHGFSYKMGQRQLFSAIEPCKTCMFDQPFQQRLYGSARYGC